MLAEIERFVNWVRRRSPNAHTWQDYRCDLTFFLQSAGDRPLGKITFQDVDRFIAEQSEKGFKPTTINRRLASIAALYAFLMPEDETLVCPVFPRRHHLREPQRLPRPVQEADLRGFFAVIEDTRDRAMFTLMLRCGLRIGEVAHLQLSDLYLEEDYPRMVVRGKGSRERPVYLSPQAVRMLTAYLATRPTSSSDFVFLSYQLRWVVHPCHSHAPAPLPPTGGPSPDLPPLPAFVCQRLAQCRYAGHQHPETARPPLDRNHPGVRHGQRQAGAGGLFCRLSQAGRVVVMCPPHAATTIAEQYDQALKYARDQRLPPEAPRPRPTRQWPPENVRLLERYYTWLIEGGTAEFPTDTIYLPMAGHILGLNPISHPRINLEDDLEKAMVYIPAKGVSAYWLKACRNGLEKFKRFLRLERGLGEAQPLKPFDVAAHTQGLPLWLVSELERFQHLQQRNWRTARLDLNLRGFWSKYVQLWRFLCQERRVQRLADLKRAHILDYIDHSLASGYSTASVNAQIRRLHSFLLFSPGRRLQRAPGAAAHPRL